MTYKLLIVDDSKLARMAAAKAMKALYPDWHRVEASNADEALALAKDRAFDVALVDFNMPGRDGLQLAADLKSYNPSMPLALVSANTRMKSLPVQRQLERHFWPSLFQSSRSTNSFKTPSGSSSRRSHDREQGRIAV